MATKQAPPLTLGQRLRAHREARGLTKYAVAQASGISQGYIRKVEEDAGEVSWSVVVAIADAVGVVSLDELR